MGKLNIVKWCIIFSISCFSTLKCQLVGSQMPIWEKATSHNAKDSLKCTNEQLLNFNCNIKDLLSDTSISYHKSRPHSLIAVHASGDEEWVWKNKDHQVKLGNTKFEKERQKATVKIDKKPSLYSYVAPYIEDDNIKGDSIVIELDDHHLYELVFTPKKIKPAELRKIHSYLSIKYGVSLVKEKYYSSDGKVIWDPAKHKNHTFRPTGIGRDDGNELYQKQSSNQEDRYLTIAKDKVTRTNFQNSSVLNNNTFAIWSDDDKELIFSNDGEYDVLKRSWEINFIGDITKDRYTLQLDKAKVNPESLPVQYWVFLTKADGTVEKKRGEEKNGKIVFSDVIFDTGQSTSTSFTFALNPLRKGEADNSGENQTNNSYSESISSEIMLYPNPVKMGQTFYISFPPIEGLEIAIFDTGGRLISKQSVDPKAVKYLYQLNVGGLYLINLTQHGKPIKTFKLIVQ